MASATSSCAARRPAPTRASTTCTRSASAGHLNPGDVDLAGGLRREWREEVQADFEPEFELIGLLNDDTTDVGGVHVGAVYVADARGRPVTIRETEKLSGAFAEPSEVAAVVDRMETWSALVFEHLEGARV